MIIRLFGIFGHDLDIRSHQSLRVVVSRVLVEVLGQYHLNIIFFSYFTMAPRKPKNAASSKGDGQNPLRPLKLIC
jgi:hypothetical protein